MKRVSQKSIKSMIASGYANNLELHYNGNARDFSEFVKTLDLYRTHYSSGVYGVNGSVWLDKDGNAWAIASRSSALMAIV